MAGACVCVNASSVCNWNGRMTVDTFYFKSQSSTNPLAVRRHMTIIQCICFEWRIFSLIVNKHGICITETALEWHAERRDDPQCVIRTHVCLHSHSFAHRNHLSDSNEERWSKPRYEQPEQRTPSIKCKVRFYGLIIDSCPIAERMPNTTCVTQSNCRPIKS